jgi:hypothetical protein
MNLPALKLPRGLVGGFLGIDPRLFQNFSFLGRQALLVKLP